MATNWYPVGRYTILQILKFQFNQFIPFVYGLTNFPPDQFSKILVIGTPAILNFPLPEKTKEPGCPHIRFKNRTSVRRRLAPSASPKIPQRQVIPLTELKIGHRYPSGLRLLLPRKAQGAGLSRYTI